MRCVERRNVLIEWAEPAPRWKVIVPKGAGYRRYVGKLQERWEVRWQRDVGVRQDSLGD